MTPFRRSAAKGLPFHGFILAGALWAYYGMTLGLKAGVWGFFAPEISRDVGLSTTQIGLVAGILLGGASIFMPLAGMLIGRHGARASMVLGLCIGLAGLLLMSMGTRFIHFLLAAFLIAASISFAGLIPIVTLIADWFDRYRSRAMAVIFTASPIWGALSYPTYGLLLHHISWRATIGWLTIVLPLGLLIVLLFIRNSPADLGQTVDGLPVSVDADAPVGSPADDGEWTARTAFTSLPFATITLSTTVAMMPFLYFQTYGRLLLASVHVPTAIEVGALMSLTIASLFGRIVAALGDFIEARMLMLLSLIGNVVGILLVVQMREAFVIYAGVFLLGASFGLSLLLAPLLLARTFGPRIFSTVEGVRSAIAIGLNAGLIPCFGMLIDHHDSFTMPFLLVLALNLFAVVLTGLAYLRRHASPSATAPNPTLQ